jgi:hypothetical protein
MVIIAEELNQNEWRTAGQLAASSTASFLFQFLDLLLPAEVGALVGVGRELSQFFNTTAAAVKWNTAARAEYYRVWIKVHGSTEDYAAVGSPADLDFTNENLPASSTIDIVVSAVNNGGEFAVSEVITVTTH